MPLSKSSSMAFAVLVAMTAAASAQTGPIPAERAAQIRQIGRVVDPAKTAPIYAPLQETEPYKGVRIERDIKYGDDAKHGLDVFMPEASGGAPRPVLVFVHGGAFLGGDKHNAGTPFYDNLMLWAVRNGFVGVNINYRLAPAALWPLAAQDVASAMQWVSQNIAKDGGDTARVFLMGHSAGATHVASYVSHPEFFKVQGGGMTGGTILVSGTYDLKATPINEPQKVYFGLDSSRYEDQLSFKALLASATPLMLAAAELDPPSFVQQFEMLKEAICKRPSGCVPSYLLPQHSHMSEMYAINSVDDRLTDKILNFTRGEK
jgi:triacylglycerol lipase